MVYHMSSDINLVWYILSALRSREKEAIEKRNSSGNAYRVARQSGFILAVDEWWSVSDYGAGREEEPRGTSVESWAVLSIGHLKNGRAVSGFLERRLKKIEAPTTEDDVRFFRDDASTLYYFTTTTLPFPFSGLIRWEIYLDVDYGRRMRCHPWEAMADDDVLDALCRSYASFSVCVWMFDNDGEASWEWLTTSPCPS